MGFVKHCSKCRRVWVAGECVSAPQLAECNPNKGESHSYEDGWPSHVERPRDAFDTTKPETWRKGTMKQCGCRLCYLCLNPPKTFEDAALWGFDRITAESASVIFGRGMSGRVFWGKGNKAR